MDNFAPNVTKVVVVQDGGTPENFYEDKLNAFPNCEVFTSAVDALQYLEQNPANILVAEHEMQELNGIDVAEAIRDIDAEREHFTYVIVTAENVEVVGPSNEAGSSVDAFVDRNDGQMLHCSAIAGARVASRIKDLIADNAGLRRRCEYLERAQLLDPVTGLGNRRFAEETLSRSIRQIESRGGAVCFLSIALENYEQVVRRYDEKIASDLMSAVAARVQHLVRPLDTTAHFETGEFALILVQPTIEQCTASCYQRIFDGVRLKSYKTAAGYLDVKIAMSVCAATAESGAPDPAIMIRTARENLKASSRSEKIVVKHLTSGL